MKINYNGHQIALKFTFRADMLFEDATGKTFTASSESEWLQYMFCVIVALTKDETLKFDAFLDWISENPTVFYDFIEWYGEFQKGVMELRKKTDEEADDKSKKKVSRSNRKK